MVRPKRLKNGNIIFRDYPEFKPNITPREMFLYGSYGGTYWRPIDSKITGRSYRNQHKKFPKSWWKGIPDEYLTSEVCDKSINRYGVKSGTSLRFWERKKWITEHDPYGWVQWYCNFYTGRRIPEEDERQISRWLGIAGENGRFRKWLINQIKNKRKDWYDESVSPKIRQLLLQWDMN